MERLKNMGLKRAFLLFSVFGMAAALLLVALIFMIGSKIVSGYPTGGVMISWDGVVREMEKPTEEQMLVMEIIGWVEAVSCVTIPVVCLGVSGFLFYRYKLKEPIAVLQMGTERIREHDLDFSLPQVSKDELGQVCAAFEIMRAKLLQTNQELWRQAEERKRLNAAFSHDLRNPVTVLKGTVKQLRQGTADEQALERMETYVLRIERYVEAMSSIQRLEQIPVQKKNMPLALLRDELAETVRLLAPEIEAVVTVGGIGAGRDAGKVYRAFAHVVLPGEKDTDPDMMQKERGSACGTDSVLVDHGLFLTVAENLIGNAARYAQKRIQVDLTVCEGRIPCGQGSDGGEAYLLLTVQDDGKGYPVELVTGGPRPFGRMDENKAHFGMGLYSSQLLCKKHGGELILENGTENGGSSGAVAGAVFSIS